MILLQDDRHINNTGYCRYSVVLGTKSAFKHNIFLQIYVRFGPDPMRSDAKNTLASKKLVNMSFNSANNFDKVNATFRLYPPVSHLNLFVRFVCDYV